MGGDPRRVTAEFVGTALLLAAVVGSGIMGARLASGNTALALLANAIATGAVLVAIILAFADVSGAHCNPVVTLVHVVDVVRQPGGDDRAQLDGHLRRNSSAGRGAFVMAQCVGAGIAAALFGWIASPRTSRRSGVTAQTQGGEPMSQVVNVLFICTGNSARSILAEAAINHPAIGGGKFRGFSAGSHPKGEVHPLALDLLTEQHFPTEGLRSKSWDEFARPGAPVMDFVFTVCDQAAGEPCPFWPGQPYTAHWGVPDPAAVSGTPTEERRAFRDAYLTLRHRIELLACLPLEKLSGLAIGERLREIGRST